MQGTRADHVAYHKGRLLLLMANPYQPFTFLALRTVTVGSQSPRGQLYGWLPLSDAAGIIILQFDIPILFHYTMSFLCWALQIPVLDTPELRIRQSGNLSNKHHVLSPKNRGSWSRKSTSVEKTAIFEVFGNLLADRRLRGFLSVNKRFTKYKFAKGKVSLRERPCFAV